MITISTYQITPYLAEGSRLPHPNINNGVEWLREAVNTIYNRNKERLKVAGVQTNHFHNHDEQSSTTIIRYPLIQYLKVSTGYLVTGIDEGGRALDELFIDVKQSAPIDDRLQIGVKKLSHSEHEVSISNNETAYSLTNWLPFSRDNFTRYKQMNAISEKVAFLEHMLLAHLLKDFAHYLNIEIDPDSVRLTITGIDSFTRSCLQVRVNKHIHDFQPFTVSFLANLTLPPDICLGNGKAFGFGLLQPTLCPA